MRISPVVTAALLFPLVLLGACSSAPDEPPPLAEAFACQAGAWSVDEDTLMAVTPVTGGLRYRLLDGRSGNLTAVGKSPGDELQATEGWRETGPVVATARFEPCADGRMRFSLADGPSGVAIRLPLQVQDTRFRSGDLELRGRLVLPAAVDGPLPLAVLVHGSERYSGVDSYPLQYLLPARGIAVFVYDKRGTGGSEGRYTQDFHLLAADAVAALAEARRLRPDGFSRAGFVGSSQGGWIAPLAASRSDADYVVALYGLAENALAEDREQVMNDLRAKGHGEDVLAKAHEVTDATSLLMLSGFTRGFDEFEAVHRKYGDEAWFSDIDGEFSGQILRFPPWMPQWIARRVAAREDVGTSWDYEPMPVLEALSIPQLWVIAADDLEAPNAETLRRVRLLQSRRRPVDLVVFPHTDHGIYEFETSDEGRVMLRHPEGYFRLLADWIRRPALEGEYGSAALEPARRAPAIDAAEASAAQPD